MPSPEAGQLISDVRATEEIFVPYQNIEDGLYLLMQKSIDKGIDHYGILDIGNRLNIEAVRFSSQPVVIHQTPPSIQVHWLQDTGTWNILGKITDEPMAIGRIIEASKNPLYNLFGNNCEHFARFVATGVRESRQVQAAVFITGLAALTAYALTRK